MIWPIWTSPTLFSVVFPTPLYAPGSLAFFVFLEHAQNIPASRPVYLLFPSLNILPWPITLWLIVTPCQTCVFRQAVLGQLYEAAVHSVTLWHDLILFLAQPIPLISSLLTVMGVFLPTIQYKLLEDMRTYCSLFSPSQANRAHIRGSGNSLCMNLLALCKASKSFPAWGDGDVSALLIAFLELDRQRYIESFCWRMPHIQSQYFSEDGSSPAG